MTDIITKAQLEAARERCEAAAEGPWHWMRDGCRVVTAHSKSSLGKPRIAADIPVGHRCESDLDGDGSFIAHARADLPAALATIEKMEMELLKTAAHLAAAISLLRNSPKTGAPSDTMFDMMIEDYERALNNARTLLRAYEGETE